MPKQKKLAPVHPGEILQEEFLSPMSLTPYALAKAADVPRTRIERLVRGDTPITADTAMRLGLVLGVDPEFWMNLQAAYDLQVARRKAAPAYRALKPLA